jgi:hypothetical protein
VTGIFYEVLNLSHVLACRTRKRRTKKLRPQILLLHKKCSFPNNFQVKIKFVFENFMDKEKEGGGLETIKTLEHRKWSK